MLDVNEGVVVVGLRLNLEEDVGQRKGFGGNRYVSPHGTRAEVKEFDRSSEGI